MRGGWAGRSKLPFAPNAHPPLKASQAGNKEGSNGGEQLGWVGGGTHGATPRTDPPLQINTQRGGAGRKMRRGAGWSMGAAALGAAGAPAAGAGAARPGRGSAIAYGPQGAHAHPRKYRPPAHVLPTHTRTAPGEDYRHALSHGVTSPFEGQIADADQGGANHLWGERAGGAGAIQAAVWLLEGGRWCEQGARLCASHARKRWGAARPLKAPPPLPPRGPPP